MNTDDTLPPNNPRGWMIRAGRWLKANPDLAWPMGTFMAGILVGWALL